MSEIQSIKDRVNRMIEREIEFNRKRMGEEAWQIHGEWVTANIVTAAKLWLKRELKAGRL